MKEPWVLFTLSEQLYCTPATQIQEIITYRPASPVPGAPAGVEGIITVRKDKITVLSGCQLVTKKDVPTATSGHIILLDTGEGTIGVAVDSVEGMANLDPETIEPTTTVFDAASAGDRAFLGTLPHDGQLITAVDLDAFCNAAIAEEGAVQYR